MGRKPQRDVHQGRVTVHDDSPTSRPRPPAVTITAWLIVAGMTLAVVVPVLSIIFG